MRSRLSRSSLRLRRGGVTPLAVLSISMLIGVLAVAVDGGTLIEQRRHVQATADAAALAAAADLYANYAARQGADTSSNTAAASAQAIAAANGFTNDGINSIVTVNISPANYQGGPNMGKPLPPGYVEVIIQHNAGRMFSNVFGSGTIPVRGRAVARGKWTPISNSVMALNLNASGSVTVNSGAGLKIAGDVQVNSASSTALNVSGTLTASGIHLNSVGGLISSLLSTILSLGGSPAPTYGSPIPDPLRYLTPPDPVKLGLAVQSSSNLSINSSQDLYPGVYTGGISVNGSATVTLHANSDGTPGIYYLQGGGLRVSQRATITTASTETAGVMVYNDWQASGDAITVSSLANLTLVPPASGLYQGLSIFQARGTSSTAAPTLTMSATGSFNVIGTIYAAYANLAVSGSGTSNVYGGQIIADTLTISGTGTVNINSGGKPGANTRILGLVE